MSMIGNLVAVSPAVLDELLLSPEGIGDFLYETAHAHTLDIDKAWHAIHFILTGQAWGGEFPHANVVFGVLPIGDEDVAYGPAMATSAAQVQQIAQALHALPDTDFQQKFNPSTLAAAEIYPQGWDAEDAIDYVVSYFQDVRKFYEHAANNGLAVISFLN